MVSSLENEAQELTATLEYVTNKRKHLLEVETELARYEAVKALCEVHQGLETSQRLLAAEGLSLPEEVQQVLRYAGDHLQNLGVERINKVGDIVPRDLVDHLSREPKGTLVEIFQAGYKLTATGIVIYPAIAFKNGGEK